MANLSNINNILRTNSTGVGIFADAGSYPLEISSAGTAGIKLLNTAGATYDVYANASEEFIIAKNGVGDRLVINSGGNATFAGSISGTSASFSASINASGNSNTFGNTTTGALSASSGTFSASVTAAGNTNSFGATTFTTQATTFNFAGGPQLKFLEPGRAYTEAMRLIRFEDEFGFHYGGNANEEAFTVDKFGNSRVYHKLGIRVDGDAIPWRGTAQIPAVINLAGNGAVFTRPDVTYLSQNFYYNASDIGAVIDAGKGSLIELTAGELKFSNTTTGASANAAISVVERIRINSSGVVSITNESSDGLIIERTGTTTGKYRFGIGGTNLLTIRDVAQSATRMAINSSGNVGIGTTSPNNKLEVIGGEIRVSRASSTTDVKINNSTAGLLNSDLHLAVTSSGEGQVRMYGNYPLTFYTNNAERMRIDSSGNIGIDATPETGMVTYVKQLRIGEQSAFQGHADGVGQDSATWLTTNYKFTSSGTVFINGTAAAPGFSTFYQQQVGDHSFGCSPLSGVAGAATGSRIQLMIKQSGNVGIGNTNPTNYKLDVNGTVRGDSFSVEGASARIFAPTGATYNGSGTQTGYLIIKLPDNGASGINNMMTGLIRVFDYTSNESFDVHFAGYWYAGYNWTNCTAWIDSAAYDDRNFNVMFGGMTGSAGAGSRPYLLIGESTSTWTYCKFSVINYEPGHSNYQAYKWDSGWNMDLSVTNPGTVLRTINNPQTNNWARTGQNLYYGSGSGSVGIGDTNPSALANRLTIAASGGTGNVVDISTGSTSNNNVGAIVFRNSARAYCGQITVNGATAVTSYLSASDYRLKEDLQDFQGLSLVSNIKVYDYKWKSTDERTYGVMAHELQEVLPQAVNGEKDAEEMQGVDYSKIVPLLIKAIQELKAEIEILKKK